MKRSTSVRWILGVVLAGCVAASGCKKEEEPAVVPVTNTPAAPATPDPTPAPAASDSGSPAASPSGTPAATPPGDQPAPVATTTAPKKGESIDACCNALRAVQKSGKTAIAKQKAAAAAAVCPGIAKLVKDGTTSRSSGLSQIRSALTGFDAPSECR